MEYKFQYKIRWFWRSISVIGHSYDKDQDKIILYKKDGSVEEIPKWTTCSVKLGVDWVLSVKKNMEKQSGQQISINQEG